MDFEPSSLKLEKLSNSNYYSWKQKIQHVLALKDLEEFIEEGPPQVATELLSWKKKDRKAQAIIGLSLSNSLKMFVNAQVPKICGLLSKMSLNATLF